MSQHDFNIANQTFPSFRADLNDALQAAATISAGASAPTTPYAYQLWYDTANEKYMIRNAANSAWLNFVGIDTNGNVDVTGTVTATGATTTNNGLILQSSSVTKSALNIAATTNQGINGTAAGDQYNWTTGGKMLWSTNNGTNAHLVLDSSGNLLVATTSTGPAVSNTETGVALGVVGYVAASRSGDASGLFNRLGTDGNIVNFNKDGTTVGSIGTYSSRMYIGTGDVGLQFLDAADNILPINPSTPANRDGAIDLGAGTVRFKDLYLSGGVYLGGTGSANYLDDYEEGSFNFVLTGSASAPTTSQTTTGYYTKVGRFVTITAYFNNKDLTGASGDLKATGLPFVSNSDSTNRGANTCALFGFSFSGSLYVDVPPNSTTVFFQESRSNSSWVPIAVSAASTKYVQLTLNYMTS